MAFWSCSSFFFLSLFFTSKVLTHWSQTSDKATYFRLVSIRQHFSYRFYLVILSFTGLSAIQSDQYKPVWIVWQHENIQNFRLHLRYPVMWLVTFLASVVSWEVNLSTWLKCTWKVRSCRRSVFGLVKLGVVGLFFILFLSFLRILQTDLTERFCEATVTLKVHRKIIYLFCSVFYF